MKPIGQLKGGLTQAAPLLTRAESSHIVGTAWCESVDLLPFRAGSKTRTARVWLALYGQSKIWGRVFHMVRFPVLIDGDPVCMAANQSLSVGKPYSWMMWARKRVGDLYPTLVGDPDFTLFLRHLTGEWMPSRSQDGRLYIAKALKLGGFEAEAFSTAPRS